MKSTRLTPLAQMLLAGLGLAASSVQAQVSTCSANVTNASGIYTGAQLNINGNISITCNYVTGSRNQTIYVGIDNGEGGTVRNLTRQNAVNTLAYLVLRPTAYTANWTTGNGVALGTTTNNRGLNLTFNYPAGTNTLTVAAAPRFRVAAGTVPAPGVYDDSAIGVFVRQTNQGGTLLANPTMVTTVSVLSQCFFSSAPSALTMNYTSFAAAASTGSSNFMVTCTQTTPYSLALDAASGTLLGLNYTLALSQTNAIGTAFPQNFTVNGTIAAGQVGTCATANCTATQMRTLTISY